MTIIFDSDNTYLELRSSYAATKIARVELKTGRVLTEVKLSLDGFATGMALWDNQLYLTTWKER